MDCHGTLLETDTVNIDKIGKYDRDLSMDESANIHLNVHPYM